MAHKNFSSILFHFDESISMFRGDKPIFNSEDMVEKFISFEGSEEHRLERSYIGTSNVHGLIPTYIQPMVFYYLTIDGREIMFCRDIWLRWCVNIEEEFDDIEDDNNAFFILIDEGDYYWVEYIRTNEDFDDDNEDFNLLINDWQW